LFLKGTVPFFCPFLSGRGADSTPGRFAASERLVPAPAGTAAPALRARPNPDGSVGRHRPGGCDRAGRVPPGADFRRRIWDGPLETVPRVDRTFEPPARGEGGAAAPALAGRPAGISLPVW